MLESGRKPIGLYVHGVVCNAMEPRRLGGFSDVYLGLLDGKAVALKQLRFDPRTDLRKSIQVCAPDIP